MLDEAKKKSISFSNTKILLGLLFVSILFDLLFFSYTLEDAQITYRYSLRFSEGYDFGMWNRTGSPVEGFTTFLWMIYLSFFGPSLEIIVTMSKVTGILAHQSILLLLFYLYLQYNNNVALCVDPFKNNEKVAAKAFFYSSISVVVFLPLCWYASSGMETLVFIALICYVFFLPVITSNFLLLSIVSILLVITRPDGIFFALASPLYYWFITKNKKFSTVAIMALLAFGALTAFRYYYFGYLMPNTYYAKSANVEGMEHLKHGVLYFAWFVFNYLYLFMPIVLALLATLRSNKKLENSFLLVAFVGVGVYFLVVAKAGGDNVSAFPMWRHGLNVSVLIIFCAFFSIHYLSQRYAKKFSVVVVLLLFILPLLISAPDYNARFLRAELISNIKRFPDLSNVYNNNEFLLWIKSISDENTVISTALAGALPLTVDAFHIDVLGLNDEIIAHNGTFDVDGPIDSKSDMGYVISQRPDIIEGYMNAKQIIKSENLQRVISIRKKMNLELINSQIFKNEYLIITNAPYEVFNRVLFVHKSYYQKIRNKHDIKVMPVDTLVSAALKL